MQSGAGRGAFLARGATVDMEASRRYKGCRGWIVDTHRGGAENAMIMIGARAAAEADRARAMAPLAAK